MKSITTAREYKMWAVEYKHLADQAEEMNWTVVYKTLMERVTLCEQMADTLTRSASALARSDKVLSQASRALGKSSEAVARSGKLLNNPRN